MILASSQHPAPEWKVVSFHRWCWRARSFLVGKVYLRKGKAGFGLSQCFTQSASHLPQELVVEQVQIALAAAECEGCFGTPPAPPFRKWVKLYQSQLIGDSLRPGAALLGV
jgi:hypothetical protein